jgi:hypothetical protein
MSNNKHANACGQIPNFMPYDLVEHTVKTLKKFNWVDGEGNSCYGVDKNHVGYLWFCKTILRPIAQQFNPDLKLIFGMLLDCVVPFDIHNDIKTPPDPMGKPYLSFLIPYAVNNDPALCCHASTIIFDLLDPESSQHDVSNIYEEKISHVSYQALKNFSLKQELVWNQGDLLWWDSQLFHVSNDFRKNGFVSKQAIVMHTYVL